MIDVMLDIQKYVPAKETQSDVTVDGCSFSIAQAKLYPILFGGDQMSAARYRGSKVIRRPSTSPLKRLEGLTPVIEDWHTEVTLLKVCISVTYILRFKNLLFIRLFG